MFADSPWPQMTGHEVLPWTDGGRAGEDSARYYTCSSAQQSPHDRRQKCGSYSTACICHSGIWISSDEYCGKNYPLGDGWATAWVVNYAPYGGASSAVRAQCNYLGVWPY